MKGIFVEHKKGLVAYGGTPDKMDMLWIDPETGVTYSFDVIREKWLSTAKPQFEYARKGSAKGIYIPILGDLDAVDDVYKPRRPSTVTGIFCRSRAGNEYAEFELHKNKNVVFTFGYEGDVDRTFSTNILDFDIEPTDQIQVYIKQSSKPILNTVCRVETSWRYDI